MLRTSTIFRLRGRPTTRTPSLPSPRHISSARPARSISQTPPNRNSPPSSFWCRDKPLVAVEAHVGRGINADQFSEHGLREVVKGRRVCMISYGVGIDTAIEQYAEVYTSIFGTKGVETTPTPDFIEALLDGKAQLDQELNKDDYNDSLWEDDPPEDPLTTQTSHQMLYETIMQIHKNLDSPVIAKTAKTGHRRSLHRRRVAEQAVSSVAWAGSDGETGTETVMEAIGIKKIRRKKMNKHKWKKRRRLVRDSSRYNKEKRKKSGPLREKQE
ncbi:hypothetical protein BC829DRAFT_397576 [Chytridium lagenaria]|nr:hypothetical protein BC829DRAFT_397576 [Chytridium lagenaria]